MPTTWNSPPEPPFAWMGQANVARSPFLVRVPFFYFSLLFLTLYTPPGIWTWGDCKDTWNEQVSVWRWYVLSPFFSPFFLTLLPTTGSETGMQVRQDMGNWAVGDDGPLLNFVSALHNIFSPFTFTYPPTPWGTQMHCKRLQAWDDSTTGHTWQRYITLLQVQQGGAWECWVPDCLPVGRALLRQGVHCNRIE